jgi:magnesium chelatase subunit D
MPSSHAYPFSAVVGQDDYKLALLANAVDPAIGGVLAIGERGTAKSTLARAFSALIGDAAPFVELPLGATVDRLTGSLDTAKLLAGEGAELSPGLLARADGGVLYADEVNLLGDHLVDVLLDAAAFGTVRVERDGLSAQCDARFLLVGTMNPEEGALRPQLLDRFGLSVWISAPTDAPERAEIVQRRITFEQYPDEFCARFVATEEALRSIVERARAAWIEVDLADEQLALIARLCVELGVEGMRADLVVTRTAVALAALDDRRSVIDRDIETAARLALGHRARTSATEPRWIEGREISEALQSAAESSTGETRTRRTSVPRTEAGLRSAGKAGPQSESATDSDAAPTGGFVAGDDGQPPAAPSLTPDALSGIGGAPGRGAKSSSAEQPSVDSRPTDNSDDLDLIATARAAVTRRLFGAQDAAADELGGPGADVMQSTLGDIRAEDLRENVRAGRESNLLLCVVDASSSVLVDGRGGELRALLGGLVSDARRKRDRVGLIVFSGREAKLVAPPSRNHAAVLSGLDRVEPGGTTPLADGLRVARETAMRELRRNPDLRPIVALVTDGHANVGSGGDALAEAQHAARTLRRDGIKLVVIGETTSGAPRFARTTGAEFYPFDPPAEERDVA